jgi:hypothetical protein
VCARKCGALRFRGGVRDTFDQSYTKIAILLNTTGIVTGYTGVRRSDIASVIRSFSEQLGRDPGIAAAKINNKVSNSRMRVVPTLVARPTLYLQRVRYLVGAERILRVTRVIVLVIPLHVSQSQGVVRTHVRPAKLISVRLAP